MLLSCVARLRLAMLQFCVVLLRLAMVPSCVGQRAQRLMLLRRPAAVTDQLPAEGEDGGPCGPSQQGRGVHGQYVYWVTMAYPKPASIAKYGLRVPTAFTREEYCKLLVDAHRECGTRIVETAGFQEPHADGTPHHNCLLRADAQYRWKLVAEFLFRSYRVSVNFAPHIKTWAEGVVYGCVATADHKPPEALDHDPVQWAEDGAPMGFAQVIPKKWQAEGFSRTIRMTTMSFLAACREHKVQTEDELWALAADGEEKGDKALMAFLMDNDASSSLAKAQKAITAKETARRLKLSRLDILKEYAEKEQCACSEPGQCYVLLKDVLQKNNIDGAFQREVVSVLTAGRKKMRNLCVVGGPNMAKSFLFKPLLSIFKTYEMPDGGSYQLEDLLGKELVFLNDFEYDDDAKKWMTWAYLKRFLEGGDVPVARPKNRGGNVLFKNDAPVFLTAPQEVSLWRGKRVDEFETEQMRCST
jgi:hypothetical protein